jgi:hypothetical protein
VTSSARNVSLVDGIADAFIKAVSQLCRHSTLKYQWMRYLPQKIEYPWAPFWKVLIDKITYQLQSSKVLKPKSHGNLRRIQDMRPLPGGTLDENGDPLFDDLDPEEYLASEYLIEDLDRLKDYGLRLMNMGEYITRVQRDLNRSFGSRMRSPATDEEWHSRAADNLNLPFVKNWSQSQTKVKALPLVPLTTGRWVSTSSCSVYYAHINGVPVPRDLSLYLVDPHAAENTDRKQLFDYLGVQESSVHEVRDLILEKYEYWGIPGEIDIATSQSHLRFFYLTTNLDGRSDSRLPKPNLWMFDHLGRFRSPAVHDFYIPNDKPYGAQELFRSISPRSETYAAAPGLDVSFVHREYVENSPERPEGQAQPWAKWLKKSLFIKDELCLTE